MKKIVLLLSALFLTAALFGQETTPEESDTLTAGKNATLGVEATTGFVWDIESKSAGLETKVGLELNFPLFPEGDRGVSSDNYDTPAVRLALKNAAFTWLNTFEALGGNYEQDTFNSWVARPLVLTFDSITADVVWQNYFFRIAGSTTMMKTDTATLFSIFDDVMNAGDRWYYNQPNTLALWHTERYNIENFPLLREKITRDYIDDDYRDKISGQLAFGAEFDMFSAVLKIASYANGKENNDNAWLIGADFEIVPMENLKFDLTGFAGFNYDKVIGSNPINFGAGVQYQIPLSDELIITPKLGFDFSMDTVSEDSEWELGAGFVVYTRGFDLIYSRLLDWDEVIPVGASLSLNLNQDSNINLMLSAFDPAGPDSLLPNFGGFLQLELADLTSSAGDMTFAVLTQLEYNINGKISPYLRGGYGAEFQLGSASAITGNYIVKTGLGCYLTPIHFFSIDVRYEMNTRLMESGDTETASSLFSTVFTIRM